jgi:hypothetical protein
VLKSAEVAYEICESLAEKAKKTIPLWIWDWYKENDFIYVQKI